MVGVGGCAELKVAKLIKGIAEAILYCHRCPPSSCVPFSLIDCLPHVPSPSFPQHTGVLAQKPEMHLSANACA